MVIVAVVAFGAAAAGIGVRASYGAQTTADEPHYLLTALSIAQDGDLDVRDEYLARDYLPFYEHPPGTPGGADGRRPADRAARPAAAGRSWPSRSALGGWVAAKLTLCLIAAALAALVLWTCVRRFAMPVAARGGRRAAWSRRRSRWRPTARRSTRRSPPRSAPRARSPP